MSLIWPYPTKDWNQQFRRIDKGIDLQVPVGTPVLAVADGTIFYAHDATGFGDPYPVLTLTTPVQGNPAVYYGHQHPTRSPGPVRQGDVVAYASQVSGGNAYNLPGWLEIGWWNNGPTGNGQSMHDTLINAPIFLQGDDMPLSADDLTKITTIVQQQVFQLLADFFNNQYAPILHATKAEVDAIKAKVGA